ncbi:vesicle transport protein SFT2B [Lycorma delicatula]|uniref:vesicle transport protein SFT2B n=1 Tax=Lycorma delicatula TaxID=130591 RepID=UPI003F516E2A
MDKLRKFLNGDETRDDDSTTGIVPGFISENSLSWSTRLKAFIICFILGIFVSFLGSLSLFIGKPLAHFALFYTLGNIISMLSTCFLMGPVNQIKRMFAETRIIATVMVFVMIGLTLFAALWIKKAPLALLFIILQWIAMTWYSLSYIPYARDAVKKTVTTCIA